MADATVSDHSMSGVDEARLRAALEIQVARLIDELDSARQLHRISSELLFEQRPEVLSEQILEAMISVMRSQAASMQMLEPHSGTLKLFAWRGFDAASAAFWSVVDAGSASSCGTRRCKQGGVSSSGTLRPASSWPEPRTSSPTAARACARSSRPH
jgi:hypothetical protein